MAGRPLIFFSDLDGTLLDHETYSHQPARGAIDALRAHHIGLILASSKTAAEIEPLRREIGFEHCEAIVENGAGLLLSGERETQSNTNYLKLIEALAEMPKRYSYHFTGFHQWDAQEVSHRTGLSVEAATRAKERQFSEPGLWSGTDDELEAFRSLLQERGIVAQKGGRFLTLSFGGTKVDRMQEIIQKQLSDSDNPFCVALGDAPNDIAMLEAADLGIIIPNASHNGIHQLAGEATGEIIRARFSGPKGWNDAVLNVLKKSTIL